MTKVMPIDFVRQVIEQTFEQEHEKAPSRYFGGKNQVNLFSFYEQLQEQHEVDRFKELYEDLVNEQNRSGIIMNGTIIAPENPQFMNIHKYLIVPMTFTCSFRVALKDRDTAIATINNLIGILKGRKQDIAEFEKGKLFMVETIGNTETGLSLKNGDYLGYVEENVDVDYYVDGFLNDLHLQGFYVGNLSNYYYVSDEDGYLRVVVYNATTQKWQFQDYYDGIEYNPEDTYSAGDMVLKDGCIYKALVDIDEPEDFTMEHWEYMYVYAFADIPNEIYTPYKLSMSFDTIRIDEPRTMNALEYCTISFGGSATLVGNNVTLGNELVKVGIRKYKVKAETDVTINETNTHWLEPLEMPSGLGISSELSQLASHNFIQNKHNDGINPTFDYSFVLDKKETLINQLYRYARYGIQGNNIGNDKYSTGVSPNMIYEITEVWSAWGDVEVNKFYAKATENVDIENTESDALSIKLTFELQKE